MNTLTNYGLTEADLYVIFMGAIILTIVFVIILVCILTVPAFLIKKYNLKSFESYVVGVLIGYTLLFFLFVFFLSQYRLVRIT